MSTLQKVFALMLLVGSLIAIYLLSPILSPFLIAMGLAYLGDPIVDRIEAGGAPRTVGVLVVFVVFFLLLVGTLLVVFPILVRETAELIRGIPAFITWLQTNTSPWIEDTFGVDPFQLDLDALKGSLTENWQKAGGIAQTVLAEITTSGLALMTAVANIVLIPVVAFYLLRDWDHIMARLRDMLPRDSEAEVVGLARECDEVLSAFLRGQLLIMILLGIIYAVGLSIVGLNAALLIGMLAGLASVVPYLGFVVGIAAASLAALFQFQDAIHLLYVLIVFGIGQALEGMVLTPLLVGDRIGLHPVAVIFAILAGGQLFGFVGILLALPVAAVVMVFLRHAHARYIESEYYGSGSE